MSHTLKVLSCLIILALSFVSFGMAVIQKEFLWSIASIFAVILCVKIFIYLDQKVKRSIHTILTENRVAEAVIEACEKGGDDKKGLLFSLLLSFTVEGKRVEKSYLTRWSSGIEELNQFIIQNPKGSSIRVLYTPKDLKVLILETNREVFTKGGSMVKNRLLKQKLS